MPHLPPPPKEVPACTDLSVCAPRFAQAVRSAIAEMERAGFDPIVSETLRTDARESYLHGFGRLYDDGRGIVTNADNAHESWHGYGLAADLISRAHQWGAPASFWQALGVAAHDEGLAWGGDWPHLVDRPHVQWGDPMRRSPSQQAEDLRRAGGLNAVWAAVGAV